MTSEIVKRQSTLLPRIDMDDLCNHVVGGGTLASYCNARSLPYGKVRNYLRTNEYAGGMYNDAVELRDDRTKQMLVSLITEMASFDPGDVFDDRGHVLPMSEWPAGARAAMAAYEHDEECGRSKVKFVDRLAAARLIGKELGIFQDKIKVEGKMTLADLVKHASEVGDEK